MTRTRVLAAWLSSSLVVAACDSSDSAKEGQASTEATPTAVDPTPSGAAGSPNPADPVGPSQQSSTEPSPPAPGSPVKPTPAVPPATSETEPSPGSGGTAPQQPEASAGEGGEAPETPVALAGAGGTTPAASAGTGGTPPDEPAGDTACDSALLCDDFEDDTSGMAPGAPWTVQVNGGAVEVSSERAFSGSNSVHVSNTAGAYKRAYFSLTGDPVFPAAGAGMYGRMMMWLEATPAGSVHWTFIQGEGPSADGNYDIYYRYGGQHEGRLMANFETNGISTDCWDHSQTVMPTQTWSCLEWRFDTATDEMQFWLDGTELSDIHVTGMGEGCGGQDLGGAWPAPAQFEVLRLGWEKYQESSELNAWIDDVAVSNERVGCPAAQ